MAQIPFRVNLSAARIPFISEFQGRTVIVQQQDQNYIPTVASAGQTADDDKDRGIPQVYYCHNVMPSAQGFESVGYITRAAAVVGIPTFQKRWIVQASNGSFVYMAIDLATRQTYVLDSTLIWTATVNAPGAGYTGGQITTAYVSGVTYINFQGDDCYTYDFGINTLVSAGIAGITIANMKGISGAAGYLIAYDALAIYWSSTILATDFVPSLVTGAGSGGVQNIKGAVELVIPISTGLIVFSDQNCVAAVYSGNSRFPFNFREIVSTGGCTDYSLVSYDANTGNLYAYTTSGLQLISSISSQTVHPDATDFIAGKLFEDFDELALTFNVTPLVNVMLKKISVISDRYLLVSYGINSLTHALVYDLVNKRWGKFKIPHVETFEYQLLGAVSSEIPRESIAFLQLNGTIKTVDFSITSGTSMGVILLGKYQFVRQRLLTLQNAAIEEIQSNSDLTVYDLPTFDGKTFGTFQQGTAVAGNTGSLVRNYRFHNSALNHSLLLIGAFYLSSIILNFSLGGRR